MDEQKDRKAQIPKKLGRRGRGGGMIPKKDDIKFIEDADGNKIFIKTIEVGKDGIKTVDMKAKGGRVTAKNGGKIAKGCGAVLSNRRKKTKYF